MIIFHSPELKFGHNFGNDFPSCWYSNVINHPLNHPLNHPPFITIFLGGAHNIAIPTLLTAPQDPAVGIGAAEALPGEESGVLK